MEIESGKIVEATENELFNYYLKRDLDEIYSFPDYLNKMKTCGVNIISLG